MGCRVSVVWAGAGIGAASGLGRRPSEGAAPARAQPPRPSSGVALTGTSTTVSLGDQPGNGGRQAQRKIHNQLIDASFCQLGQVLVGGMATSNGVSCALRPYQPVKPAAGITAGPVFRQVKTGSRLGDAALPPHAVAVLTKKRAKLAGIDPAVVSSHSLRAGYVTSCCEHGVAPMIIAEQTRHKSLDMLLVYSRRVDRYRNHSGKAFL